MTADLTARQLEAVARLETIRVANKAKYARAEARKAAKAAAAAQKAAAQNIEAAVSQAFRELEADLDGHALAAHSLLTEFGRFVPVCDEAAQ